MKLLLASVLMILTLLLTGCDGVKTEPMSSVLTTTTEVTTIAATTIVTTTTAERTKESITPAERFLPDSVFLRGCVKGNDNLTVEQFDRDTILFTDGIGKQTYIDLTEKQVAELNYLYNTVTDYTNLSWLDTAAVNTVIEKDGKKYEVCDIYTTQVELEQMLCYLNCLYRDVEYDWSVMPISDVFSFVEEERVGMPPPV